jgi:hypothetical protein
MRAYVFCGQVAGGSAGWWTIAFDPGWCQFPVAATATTTRGMVAKGGRPCVVHVEVDWGAFSVGTEIGDNKLTCVLCMLSGMLVAA